MKKGMRWVAVLGTLLTIGLLISPAAFADSGDPKTSQKPVGWLMGTSISPATTSFSGMEAIVTETGEIQKIEKVSGTKDDLQMKLKAGSNVWTVFLGPKWFIENQRMKLKANDKDVEVRGKKAGSTLIASEVSKGDLTMKLRNEEDGFPNWECCFPRKKR